MEQTANLAKALDINNPTLSWNLFKHILSSPSSKQCLQFIPVITRILARAKMLPEIDDLHRHLLLLQPQQTSRRSLISLAQVSAKSGLLDKALSQFQSLRSQFPDQPPPLRLYNVLLEHSLKENRPESVSMLYKDMLLAGISPETYTLNIFMLYLCDSGRLEDAHKVLDRMPMKGCKPNEFSYGILVRGYCKAGLSLQALGILNNMRGSGCLPNRVIYNTLISCFCREGKVDEAESLVEKMRGDGLFPDVVTFNSRISALCSGGNIEEASRIFNDMQNADELGLPRPNAITYNLMLEGFYMCGMLEEGQVLVEHMKRNGDFTRLDSYNIWLLGLVRNGKLLEAQLVFKEMVDKGLSPNIYSYNIVIYGLCKDGMLSDARMVIDIMKNNGILPDTVTYSTLLHRYCSRGNVSEANNVLNEMIKGGCFPNIFTCNILLQSLWTEGRISEAEKLLHKMNERGYNLDTVTCNIVIDGLCKSGKLDKAIEIVDDMWIHGSAALGDIGNSFIGLVDTINNGKKCLPDTISYSIIIDGLCKSGRLDEAKKKFVEMLGKNLEPDLFLYNTFIHHFCKHGKISSAFRVLRDMEKKGCNKSAQTYNLLILGLGSKGQTEEIVELMNEMRERGISPNVLTYNNLISSLCEQGKTKEATSFLDEMFRRHISPTIFTFKLLIRAYFKACDIEAAQGIFEIAVSLCGHKEALYSLVFNEFLTRGKLSEAKVLFEASIDKCFDINDFLYKDLIEVLCKEEKLEGACEILRKMIDKGCWFDPASFMPVIDGLVKKGNKHEADELAERMMEMASEGKVTNKFHKDVKELNHRKLKKEGLGGNYWQKILHRDDGSAVALKVLKRVKKGWGQGSIPSLQSPKEDLIDY